MNFTDQPIEAYFKEHGIKPSYQRIKIFEYLIRYKNHPTVDGIFKALVKEIPTLSKTTVYNTLKLFLDHNIVQRLVIEENETRYDADTSAHGHFKCENCGNVYDVEGDFPDIDVSGLKIHQVNEVHLYFIGICNQCLKNKH